jgi:hypothetical protein
MSTKKEKEFQEKMSESWDERSKIGLFLYELENFKIKSKQAIIMNKRITYFRGNIIIFIF